jgi:hypothetical protein
MKIKDILVQIMHEPQLTPLRIFWGLALLAELIISFLAIKFTFRYDGPSLQIFSLSLVSVLLIAVCAVMLICAWFLPVGQNVIVKFGLLLLRVYLYLYVIILTLKLAIETQNILIIALTNIIAIIGLLRAFPKSTTLIGTSTI